MPYTNDPIYSITDRLRLEVGDTDICEEGLTDEVYQYILSVNNDEAGSPKSILQALRYLVAKYANFEHEEAGDLEVWGEKYKNYNDLLNRLLKDPRYGLVIGGTFAGGISRQDIKDNRLNKDANGSSITEDWFGSSFHRHKHLNPSFYDKYPDQYIDYHKGAK